MFICTIDKEAEQLVLLSDVLSLVATVVAQSKETLEIEFSHYLIRITPTDTHTEVESFNYIQYYTNIIDVITDVCFLIETRS